MNCHAWNGAVWKYPQAGRREGKDEPEREDEKIGRRERGCWDRHVERYRREIKESREQREGGQETDGFLKLVDQPPCLVTFRFIEKF